MNLRLKFNLALLAIFAIASMLALWLAREQFDRDAREDVTRQADLIMEAALAVRGYTSANIKPHLDPMLNERFLPETVPAFAATETIGLLRKKYADYNYREAALNPTNPRDRADPWEAEIIQRFRREPTLNEQHGERIGRHGRQWYVARPIQIKNAQCLTCHSLPEAAPASLIRLYGSAGGFGWQLNEVIGTQLVTVPMDVPLQQADKAFRTFVASMGVVFLVTLAVLNLMLTYLIVRPVSQVARATHQISIGKIDAPEFPEGGRDEIAELKRSFNRMRRSMTAALMLAGKLKS